MTAYDDIKHLNDIGYWPSHEIPAWALEESERLGCSPTDPALLSIALMREIRRLKDIVDRLESYEA